jgi:response regulator RpfG family c-di-GMP phosphodiesterase
MNNNVLFVDDDVELLSSFERNLRKQYEITTAANGLKAIDILKSGAQFACIVSDLKMNQLSGVEFLSIAKDLAPNTPRILLTGFADLKNSIDAINKANIFRLLTKPIPVEALVKIVNEALDHFRLFELEKEMMDKTLKSTIKMLIDILSMSQPLVFSQSKSLIKIISRTAQKMEVKKLWEVEISAMLSQLGAIAIPKSILEKKLDGILMDAASERVYKTIPDISYKLLSTIPHLNKIAKIIKFQHIENYHMSDDAPDIEILKIAHIIKIAYDYELRIKKGNNPTDIITYFKENYDIYNAAIVKFFEEASVEIKNEDYIQRRNKINVYANLNPNVSSLVETLIVEIPLAKLESGMILGAPIKDTKGRVILNKGYEINEMNLAKIRNLESLVTIQEPIKILLK